MFKSSLDTGGMKDAVFNFHDESDNDQVCDSSGELLITKFDTNFPVIRSTKMKLALKDFDFTETYSHREQP